MVAAAIVAGAAVPAGLLAAGAVPAGIVAAGAVPAGLLAGLVAATGWLVVAPAVPAAPVTALGAVLALPRLTVALRRAGAVLLGRCLLSRGTRSVAVNLLGGPGGRVSGKAELLPGPVRADTAAGAGAHT